ncbi:MAG: hypothetical protein ACM31H_01035, partial [Nitrososphaerales archaeon]
MKPIEYFGAIQNTFLFSVFIPNIPKIVFSTGVGIPLTFQVKSTSIPEKSRGKTTIYTVNGRFNIPHKSKWEHTWNVQCRLYQTDILYRFITEWYN